MHISTCKIVKENKCTPTDNVVKIHICSENLIINPPMSEIQAKNAQMPLFPFLFLKNVSEHKQQTVCGLLSFHFLHIFDFRQNKVPLPSLNLFS